jgi:2'-hydroxyisoflavone reductase
MKFLILGGTVFLGRHIVETCLARGHTVTMFNRGQRNAHLFPHVEKLHGDRNGDHSALRGHAFDAVIDCSGYTPAQLQSAAEALGVALPYYLFVSSVSAYTLPSAATEYDESAPLAEGEPSDLSYGVQKARAERAIDAAYPGRVAIVRPGLIVGPHDPTGRFTYWPLRAARGGDVLAPGRPQRPVQWIDVRDLAEWIVHLAEHRIVGAFNAVTPAHAYNMNALIEACYRVAQIEARVHWVDDDTLARYDVAPWSMMPLWIPERDEASALMLAKSDKAIEHGLQFRSVDDTVSATLLWAQTQLASGDNLGLQNTLSIERETHILRDLRGN